MDGWMDEWMDGWMCACIHPFCEKALSSVMEKVIPK